MSRFLSRRAFLQATGAASALAASVAADGGTARSSVTGKRSSGPRRPIVIRSVDSNFEREPLIRPFGFKGGFLTEIWQAISLLEGASGTRRVGLGTQSVLWSDASVFARHSESGGNALMYALTEFALRRIEGASFSDPIELQEAIFEDVLAYGRSITGNPGLRETFVLNALVGVDNAAWLLYAAENAIDSFDAMVPERYRPGLSYRHSHVVSVPSIAFTIPIEEILQATDQGYFFMKIKLGMPGSQEEMLERDKERISAIHEAIGELDSPHSDGDKIPYWFDPNGRYESKDTLLRLLDHADRIGALDQIAVFEEPFPEELKVDVSGLGVRVAADESAHTDRDVVERIDLGYSVIALKAIAKTLSMTMKMAQVAHERGAHCVCADLTVNPILVDWNKTVAARLAPLPGVSMGLMESNGHQNYLRWEQMMSYHPMPDAPWVRAREGLFECGAEFYGKSAGIFEPSSHYAELVAELQTE